MNKKIISLLIAGSMLMSASVAFAAETEVEAVAETTAEQIKDDKNFVNTYTGTVKSIEKNIVTVAVETEDGEYEAAYGIDENTPIYDINGNKAEAVKEGDKVIVLSKAGLLTRDIKPVNAIVISNDDEVGSVYYDTFSKTEMGFIGSNGDLVLNIDEESQKEYEGKLLLVFYNIVTASIPAQTNPTSIVVIEDKEIELPDENTESEGETEQSAAAVNMYTGIVKAYEKNIMTVEIEGQDAAFTVTENTPVYDLKSQKKSEIKEGDSIYVFSTASLLTKDIKPVKAIVTGVEEDIAVSVKLDTFKEDEWGLISSDNNLVINVEDKEKYEDKELLIFYDMQTMSIPAQTNPLEIIVIDNEDTLPEEIKNVSISFKVGDCVLSINGNDVEVEKPYVIGEGVTLVPLRVISEAFGAKVDWNGDTKTVLIEYGDKTIKLEIDKKTTVLNDDETFELEEAPQLTENGFTMVPLRFISETLGAEVGYDEETKNISVKLNK